MKDYKLKLRNLRASHTERRPCLIADRLFPRFQGLVFYFCDDSFLKISKTSFLKQKTGVRDKSSDRLLWGTRTSHVTTGNTSSSNPSLGDMLERGNLSTYSDLIRVSPTYQLIWLILTVWNEQVTGSQSVEPPPHLFWPFLLMNVPVGHKVEQCFLEKTDRVEHSTLSQTIIKTIFKTSPPVSPCR